MRGGTLGQDPEVLTPRVRVLELIMLRLRTARGLRLKAYKTLTGRDFVKDNQRMIQALYDNGLVRMREGYLRLTRKGMLVSNAILRNLFENTDKMLALPQTQPLTMPSAADFDEEDLADLDRTLVRAAVFPSA